MCWAMELRVCRVHTLHHLSSLTAELEKNNIYQSSCFLVNANQHPGKTYPDASQLHVEMHQVQTAIQNLPAGRHCATEYIMHYV